MSEQTSETIRVVITGAEIINAVDYESCIRSRMISAGIPLTPNSNMPTHGVLAFWDDYTNDTFVVEWYHD